MKNLLTVGSRGSLLAMVQTRLVVSNLARLNPALQIQIEEITTSGDKDRRAPLEELGINVFVKELEEALLDGRIDLAVHSLKDLPTELPPGLALIAVTERADPRDVLVSSTSLDHVPPGATIGTGSLRRSIQLAQLRPDLEIVPLRGNVDTRLKQVSSGKMEGVILAAAGLIRLGLADRIREYLSTEYFLPSVGQGALALEARAGDKDLAGLVSPLNHPASLAAAEAERAFLLELGGGCRAPIAALASVQGDRLTLQGWISDLKGQQVIRDSLEGAFDAPQRTGRLLAQRMLKNGAQQFIQEVRSLESG